MYITSKKYTKEGRIRFGSSIFIDDLKENKIDKLSGIERDEGILLSIIMLTLTKLASANYLGLLITIPIFVILYFYGAKKIQISYTDQRILIEKEYQRPRVVRAFTNTLFGIILFIPFRWIFGIDQLADRVENMASIFQFLQLYDTRFFLYRKFVGANYVAIQAFDTIITLAICIWFAIRYRKIRFEFKEVNLKHVSEQLIQLKSINSFFGILTLLIGYGIIQSLFLQRFSLTWLIFCLLLFQFFPREGKIHLSLIGPSNRDIIRNAILSKKELSNVSRTTAVTFGWRSQNEDKEAEFPENIVPKEVASVYETGLRSYSGLAFKQANYIGLVISTLINVLVIAEIIQFAIQLKLQVFDIIFLVALALVIISIGFFIASIGLNHIRTETQKDEKLLIGEEFLGRYTGNSLWILSGKSTEGSTVQRGRTSKLVSYDKNRGLKIEWERFTLLLIIGTITLAIAIWNYLGAINLQALPLIFPSIVDIGLEFLERKATAELEFFIITGYVIWMLILIFYPRYYARTRPSLYIDLEYTSVEPIVLKDFDEHQNASMQFTKSLIVASHKSNRPSDLRPGTFILTLYGRGQLGEGSFLKFYIGENLRESTVSLPFEEDTRILENIVVSGIKGYPELNVIVELFNNRGDVIYSNQQLIQIFYERQKTVNLDFGIFGSIELICTIKKQKS